MKGDAISDGDHVARYCKPTTVENGVPLVAAFSMGEQSDHLSVNWLEFLSRDKWDNQIQCLREVFRAKGYTLRKNGRFAVLNVGRSIQAVETSVGYGIAFRHWPEENNESHSGIFGYTHDDLAVALELRSVVAEDDIYPAVSD